jgi:hypothetical protein
MKNRIFAFALLASFVTLFSPYPAAAAQTSTVAPVSLAMNVGESVTLTNVPNSISFTYPVGGGNSNTQNFNVTTTWQLQSTRTTVHLVFYFSGTTALNNGSSIIPTSQFFLDGSTTPTHACNDNIGDPLVPASQGHSSACTYGKAISVTGTPSGTETDQIYAQLQGLSGSLLAGSYTGTLNVQAGWN